MSWRARIVAFGSTALLVVAGAVCAAAFGGGTGQFVGFSLIGVGLVIATALVFLEVGLSEDRERARELKRTPSQPPKRPRRAEGRLLGRSRGHRRRLG